MYRQWQVVGTDIAVPNTDTIKKQKERFKKITEKWREAILERETISLSDTNIDLSKDFTQPDSLSDFDKILIPLYRMLNDNIFSNNTSVIKTIPTKVYTRKPNTFIDHLITNCPQKISGHLILKN